MSEIEQLEKEIIVVENMIDLCKRCLAIYYKERHIEAMKSTLSDLSKCKKELKRIIEAKEKLIDQARDSEKGKEANVI